MAEKPKTSNSLGQQELDKAEKQFDAFDANVKELTLDRMNLTGRRETEPQTKMAQSDIEKSKDIYLKPHITISVRDKFNEKFRKAYEFDKELVYFTAENRELIGEAIEIWTRPYGGIPAEFWKVPTNVPVWGPRHLAEQIKRKFYHRLKMEQKNSAGADGMGQYFGTMAVDTSVQRLDARPVSRQKSVFMGAMNF